MPPAFVWYLGKLLSKRSWDVVECNWLQEKTSGRAARYKLTSTAMLWLQTSKTASGTMNLGGSLTKQVFIHYFASLTVRVCESVVIGQQQSVNIHDVCCRWRRNDQSVHVHDSASANIHEVWCRWRRCSQWMSVMCWIFMTCAVGGGGACGEWTERSYCQHWTNGRGELINASVGTV